MNTLPPLTQRIDKGAAAGFEFERLLHHLLLRDGQRSGYHYEPLSAPNGDWRGVDGLIRVGRFLGLENPIGIQFKWLWGEPTLDSSQRAQIKESMTRAKALFPELKHWVLITPHELSNADKTWYEQLSKDYNMRAEYEFQKAQADAQKEARAKKTTLPAKKERVPLLLHHRGKIQIEEWFHNHLPLYAKYYPEQVRNHPDASGFDGGDFQMWARQYTSKVVKTYQNLRLLGLPPPILQHQSDSGDIPLKHVFVPQGFNDWSRGDSEAPIQFEQLIKDERPKVLLGDPGSGKSTVLQFLILLYSGEAELEGVRLDRRIPIFISLRDFVRRHETEVNFVDFLTAHARNSYQLNNCHRFFFLSALLMGEATVLFDGLDEVGQVTRREQIARAIESFQDEYPNCPIWITTRIVGYSGNTRLADNKFQHLKVLRFGQSQQLNFIEKWYQAQLPYDVSTRRERIMSLEVAIKRTLGVHRLASNPLLLTLMALIHHFQGQLPQSRGQLYDMCVDMLIEHWQKVKTPDEIHPLRERGIYHEDVKRYLAAVSLWMQERNENERSEDSRGLVPESELFAKLLEVRLVASRGDNEPRAREDIKALLEYIRERTGLLVYRGATQGEGQFAFTHLSFQEYLAAYQLSEDRTKTYDDHLAFFRKHMGHAAWEETLLMLLYRLSQSTGRKAFLDMLVSEVLREETRKAPKWTDRIGISKKSREMGFNRAWNTLGRALRDDLDFISRDATEIVKRLIHSWGSDGDFRLESFQIIEDLSLFSRRWRPLLAAQIEAASCHSDPKFAIRYIHLQIRLFNLEKPSVTKLAQRSDFAELIPDLVVFQIPGAVLPEVSKQATLRQIAAAYDALASKELYLTTLEMAETPHSDSSNERQPYIMGAAADLGRKILVEFATRSAFAIKHRKQFRAVLLCSNRYLELRHPFYTLGMVFRNSKGYAVTPTEGSRAGLLSQELGLLYFKRQWQPTSQSRCLVASLRGLIAKVLEPFGDKGAVSASHIAASCAKFFGESFLDTFIDAYNKPGAPHTFLEVLLSTGVNTDVFNEESIRQQGTDFAKSRTQEMFHNFLIFIFEQLFVRYGNDYQAHFFSLLNNYRSYGFKGNNSLDDWRGYWTKAVPKLQKNPYVMDADWFKYSLHCKRWLVSDGKGTPNVAALSTELSNPLGLPFLLADVFYLGALNYLFALNRYADVSGLIDLDYWANRNPTALFNVALSWEEHAKIYTQKVGRIRGAEGALFLMHAAYAQLMTGILGEGADGRAWRELLKDSDTADPIIRFCLLVYRLCALERDVAAEREVSEILESSPSQCKEFLEVAGFLLNGEPTIAFPN